MLRTGEVTVEMYRVAQLEMFDKAIELNPDLAIAYSYAAVAIGNSRGEAAGLAAARKAVELDPNDAEGWAKLANQLIRSARPEEAISMGKMSILLNPFSPYYYFRFFAYPQYVISDYKSALENARACLLVVPTRMNCWQLQLSSLVRLGELDTALAEAAIASGLIENFGPRFGRMSVLH